MAPTEASVDLPIEAKSTQQSSGITSSQATQDSVDSESSSDLTLPETFNADRSPINSSPDPTQTPPNGEHFPPHINSKGEQMLFQTMHRNDRSVLYALVPSQCSSPPGNHVTKNNAQQQPARIPAVHAHFLQRAPNAIVLVPKQERHATIATRAANAAKTP